MVRVYTKFPLTDEQFALLDQDKSHWWLRDLFTGGFVKAFPRLNANEIVDVDVELVDSKYCLGCGNWNTVDEQGYHCSKRVYFQVTNGSVKYFKNKAEMDATPQTSIGQTEVPTNNSYSAFGSAPKTEPPKAEPVELGYEEVSISSEVAMYCTQNEKIVSRNYNCVVDFNKRCEEINEDDCFNCTKGRVIFYKNVKD